LSWLGHRVGVSREALTQVTYEKSTRNVRVKF
jgi:hypothetical protein